MELFYVVRVGINDQGVVGICDEISKAEDLLLSAAANEPDNYHGFDIRRHELNRPIEDFKEYLVFRQKGDS
jgi:hypothetical protein